MQSILKSIACAAIGAVLALIIEVLVFGLMQGIFQGHRFYPRGAGWVMFPIAFAVLGWRYGRTFNFSGEISQPIRVWLDRLSVAQRAAIGYSVLWIMLVIAYNWSFQPFGRYWSDADTIKFWFVVVTPIALVAAIRWIANWSRRGTP